MSQSAVTVRVVFMGPVLRPRNQGREVELTLGVGTTTDDLLNELGYHPTHAKHVGIYREGVRLPRAAELNDGEELTIAVAMGGG